MQAVGKDLNPLYALEVLNLCTLEVLYPLYILKVSNPLYVRVLDVFNTVRFGCLNIVRFGCLNTLCKF